MGWTLVQDRLIAIVEGTTPEVLGGGLGPRFSYAKALWEDIPAGARNFGFGLPRFANRGAQNAIVTGKRRAELPLVMRYGPIHDRDLLLRAIGSDFELLSDRFQNPLNWDRAASGLDSMAIEGSQEEHLVAEAVDTAQGVVVEYLLAVDYRNPSS